MNDYEMQNLALLNRIANALEAIALTNAPAPNFVKPIESYSRFDFTSIGALVKGRDQNGPTELEWGGYLWTRRSPQNKFGEAIWFSRCVGKDPDGNNKYARLITFKAMSEAEPLPRKVEKLVEQTKTEQPDPSLDEVFGPNPRTPVPQTEKKPAAAQDLMLQADPPKTEAEFISWLQHRGWNGKEVYTALGTSAPGWLRLNAGKGWADVAQTIAATLGAK